MPVTMSPIAGVHRGRLTRLQDDVAAGRIPRAELARHLIEPLLLPRMLREMGALPTTTPLTLRRALPWWILSSRLSLGLVKATPSWRTKEHSARSADCSTCTKKARSARLAHFAPSKASLGPGVSPSPPWMFF